MRPTITVLCVSLTVALVCAFLLQRNPLAVAFPIDLKPGATRSPTFRPDYSGLYIVALASDPADGKRATCVLGGDAPGKTAPCENVPPVALGWTVAAHGVAVGNGGTNSPDRTWQTTYQGEGGITREIGSVMLKAGRAYEMEVHSLQDAQILAPLHPRIRVQARPVVSKGATLIRSLLFSISVVVAAFAALRLGLLIWRNVKTV